MKKPICLIFVLICLIAASVVFANGIDWKNADVDEIIEEVFDEQGNLKPEYQEVAENFNLSDAPQEARDLLEGERSNVVVELENGEEVTIGVVVEDGEIKEVKRGGIENPTSEITTTEETVREVASSESPSQELGKKFGEGKIRYESKSPETWLKGLIINAIGFLVWIFSNPILLLIFVVIVILFLGGVIFALLLALGIVVKKEL